MAQVISIQVSYHYSSGGIKEVIFSQDNGKEFALSTLSASIEPLIEDNFRVLLGTTIERIDFFHLLSVFGTVQPNIVQISFRDRSPFFCKTEQPILLLL